MALWVEKHHGDGGHDFIDAKIEELVLATEMDGVRLWEEVARRLEQVGQRTSQA